MKLVMIGAFPRAKYFLKELKNAFTIVLVSNVIKHMYSLGMYNSCIICIYVICEYVCMYVEKGFGGNGFTGWRLKGCFKKFIHREICY